MFDTGYREVVINGSDDFPLYIYDAAGTVLEDTAIVNAFDLDEATLSTSKLSIRGVGEWLASQVVKADRSRGVALQKYAQTLDDGDVFTIASPSTNEIHRIVFKTKSYNWDSLQAQAQLPFGKRIAVTIDIPSTIANNDAGRGLILTAIYTQLKEYNKYAKDEAIIIPTISAGTESAVETLVLTARDEYTEWEVELLDNDGNVSDVLSGYTAQSTTKRYEGKGTGKFIRENVRLWTDESRRPYGIAAIQQPQNGTDLYTELNFEVVKEDPSTAGFLSTNSVASNVKNRVTLFVKEDATSLASTTETDANGKVTAGYITAIAAWLQSTQTAAVGATLTVQSVYNTLDATTGEPVYIAPTGDVATYVTVKPTTTAAAITATGHTEWLQDFIS